MYGLNTAVLHEVAIATEGAIAEVCNKQGPSCDSYVNDLANATVTFVLTGIHHPGTRYDPMCDDGYRDENIRRATDTIADYLLDMCDDLERAIRLARLWNLAGRNKAA